MFRLVCTVLLLSSTAIVTADDDGWGPFGEVCVAGDGNTQLYDAAQQYKVPWYTVDLTDDTAEGRRQRWKIVARDHIDEMKAALWTVEYMLALVPGNILWTFLLDIMREGVYEIPQPYRDEILGIADVTGIEVEKIALLNMFYEISKGCTSIVAQDTQGNMFHARNQDFGTFFVWNTTLGDWQQTEALRNLLINVRYVKDGRLLFKGTTFAGHMGVLTGIRPGGWTLSTNSRKGNTLQGLVQFFHEGTNGKRFLIYADREALTYNSTFDSAVDFLSSVPLFGSGYFIVGGTQPGEGVVIARSANRTEHISRIDTSNPNGWYVLETNYDWNENVLYLDDRRGPGNDCMQRLGQEGVSLAGLYQVLSGKPNLNKATVYTAVMQVDQGILESYTRYCEDPCWFV